MQQLPFDLRRPFQARGLSQSAAVLPPGWAAVEGGWYLPPTRLPRRYLTNPDAFRQRGAGLLVARILSILLIVVGALLSAGMTISLLSGASRTNSSRPIGAIISCYAILVAGLALLYLVIRVRRNVIKARIKTPQVIDVYDQALVIDGRLFSFQKLKGIVIDQRWFRRTEYRVLTITDAYDRVCEHFLGTRYPGTAMIDAFTQIDWFLHPLTLAATRYPDLITVESSTITSAPMQLYDWETGGWQAKQRVPEWLEPIDDAVFMRLLESFAFPANNGVYG